MSIEAQRWIGCSSYDALMSGVPQNARETLITTDSPKHWGYFQTDAGMIIPVGYANLGLMPVAVHHGGYVFVGINELVCSFDATSMLKLFQYKMPSVFYDFIRFDVNSFIIGDEIGFIGLSYGGSELWTCIKDIICEYRIVNNIIQGTTLEGEKFEFVIPSDSIS